MKQLTGADMRREYNLITQALKETFVKDDDASIVLNEFMEKVDVTMSTMRGYYNKGSADRESIIKPCLELLASLENAIAQAKSQLNKHVDGETEPEDDNRDIGT